MQRIISVTDTGIGIEAKIHTRKSDNGGTEITKLELTALEGSMVRSEHLMIFAELGLKLPHPAAVPPTPAAKPVAAKPAPPAPAGSSTHLPFTLDKMGRRHYQQPPVQEMLALHSRLNGSAAAMAEHYGMPVTTLKSWIVELRRKGHPFAYVRKQKGSLFPQPPLER